MNELLLTVTLPISLAVMAVLVYMIYRIETVYTMYMQLLHEEHTWLSEHIDLLTARTINMENPEDFFRRYEALPKMRTMYLKPWITKEKLEQSVKPIQEYYSA